MMDVSASSGRPTGAVHTEDCVYWDCSVCTYRNTPKAYKCQMCDTRKGTSTRPVMKPRISQHHIISQNSPPRRSAKPLRKERRDHLQAESSKHVAVRPARLKNVDRSTAQRMAVTIGDVTVIITDYKPLDDSSEDCTDCSVSSSCNDSRGTGNKSN